MKTPLALILPLLMILTYPAQAAPREAEWKAVEEEIQAGKPQSAIAKLEPILQAALAEKAYPEAIKALSRKLNYKQQIEGYQAEEYIVRFQAEMANWPAEAQPVLETILAAWYWSYFQQNQWRFMQRTQMAEKSGDDILTWDLDRILAEIDLHFTAALAGSEALQKVPVTDYQEVITTGTMPDSIRPTLYDFLAHYALAFYNSGAQAGSSAQDAFVLDAESPIFAPLDQFLAWKVETTDEDSLTAKAIRLHQSILTFHLNDQNPDSRLDADVDRLIFGNNHATGENRAAKFKAALNRFIEANAAHRSSSKARAALAQVLRGENALAEAHAVAKKGWEAFKDTPEGAECGNIMYGIEAPAAELAVERVWNKPLPAVNLKYRNLKKAYFRVVNYDWNQIVTTSQWNTDQVDWQQARQLGNLPVLRAWNVDLPVTQDFQDRLENVAVPADLPSGFYLLLSSFDPDFTKEQGNQLNYTGFWVSDLALIMRTTSGDGKIEGFVLNALSGEPVQGAKVEGWGHKDGKRVPVPAVQTDKNGRFAFDVPNYQNRLVLASFQGQKIGSQRDYSNGKSSRRDDFRRTFLFTDRSLYRPGQIIQFKGVSALMDDQNNDYRALPNDSVQLSFRDVNGKEIEAVTLRTNDFGSFHGSFIAPRDRLMGQMTIVRTNQQRQDAASVTVEEYKRPKFKVELKAPKEAAKLDAEVSIEGEAMGYTGSPVDSGSVKYRVVREVRYPYWWGWYSWRYSSRAFGQQQEIAHGTATTDANGKFTVTFTARPDLEVPKESEPTFQFTVYADVTDNAGETRSDERLVNVGYTALQASMKADEWQEKSKAVEITLETESLDGEDQPAKGVVKIYSLKEPEQLHRAQLGYHDQRFAEKDLANPNTWDLNEVVAEKPFDTAQSDKLSFDLKPGLYRGVLETQDAFQNKVSAILPLQVLDPAAAKFELKIPYAVASPEWKLEPGEQFKALWGTGYEQGRAFVEIVHRGKRLAEYWTPAGSNIALVNHAVTENLRGGFQFLVTMVRENRAYTTARRIEVPWSTKDLTVKWESHRSNLLPGQPETWTAIVEGPKAEKAVAEMAATLYDESLDAYLPHGWRHQFDGFYQDYAYAHTQFENHLTALNYIYQGWSVPHAGAGIQYREFQGDVLPWSGYFHFGNITSRRDNQVGRDAFAMSGFGGGGVPAPSPAAPAPSAAPRGMLRAGVAADAVAANGNARLEAAKAMRPGEAKAQGGAAPSGADVNLDQVAPRKNLNETAFFFPTLVSTQDGKVRMEFKMPEALTSWKFMGFAHDAKMRSGYLEGTAVTAKDIMVQPNPPRFLREGDVLEFSAKVTNKSATRQTGTVKLALNDAESLATVEAALGLAETNQNFDIPAKESRSFSWRLKVPDGQGFLVYKAVASTGTLSDGEEGYLPVLSRRVLVTESLPLPIRGEQTKQFEFAKLLNSAGSNTLQHQSLTVQMVSNPSWYAVMALPYLMEYPYECSEQVFNRLYANSLASHIAKSDPKIERVFAQWRGTDALESPLKKNQDLKAVMVEETPWLDDADDESAARRNIGILFEDNRLMSELARAQEKLAQQQNSDGAWPWFPGGWGNDYITLYITTGYARLRHLGVTNVDISPALRALNRLDGWIDERYKKILAEKLQAGNNLGSTECLYLYCRSFFLRDQPIQDAHKPAVDYFLKQASEHWLKQSRQSQGHLALALNRFGVHPETPQAILTSLREFSVNEEEMGMFWRDTELNYWWYRAPIETQALMIEVFDEVAKDTKAVEDLKVWLLKQKQTRDWKTTKATADAVYALLLRGANLLASNELVEVSLDGKTIEPIKAEAGTGFYQERFTKTEVQPSMGKVTVKKTDPGVAWGGLHWQYLETIEKITPHEGTPLTLKKALFLKENSDEGPVLKPVKPGDALKVGDELTVRIELRTDRDMEYLHMKDQRGSGTEPMNVLSAYKYQDGLRYYESTRDTASHFFIDYLPKGTYVFEYSVRVYHRGEYQTGMALIECMYAPEFNSHSESLPLVVK